MEASAFVELKGKTIYPNLGYEVAPFPPLYPGPPSSPLSFQPCGVPSSDKHQLPLLDEVTGPSGFGRLKPFQHPAQKRKHAQSSELPGGPEKESLGEGLLNWPGDKDN